MTRIQNGWGFVEEFINEGYVENSSTIWRGCKLLGRLLRKVGRLLRKLCSQRCCAGGGWYSGPIMIELVLTGGSMGVMSEVLSVRPIE